MALQRKRYYSWLIKAYYRRWKKTIYGALALGIFSFIGLLALITFYITPLIQNTEERVGYWGTYRVEEIPDEIMKDVSMGLVTIDENGDIKGGAAKKWEIKDNKEYTFYLRDDLKFHNGLKFSSKTIPFNFENVEKEIIDEYTIKFKLDEPYSPFLSALSEPILLKDLSGLGEYKIEDIDINAGFVKTLNIKSIKDKAKEKIITFYPTEEALKLAFALGEIDIAENIYSKTLNNFYNLEKWPSVGLSEKVNENLMVTVFFNTTDDLLSDKRVRQALHYALPNELDLGKRIYSPIVESSIYFSKPPNYGISDKELASEILESTGANFEKELSIKVNRELEAAAKLAQKNWEEIGVKSKIEIVEDLPPTFQVLIYEMVMPKDPDQYILWHSDQVNNIVRYKNLRIDKLLEDGRSVTNINERKEIYSDFQKYLMDDLPASFFYQPKVYRLYRED